MKRRTSALLAAATLSACLPASAAESPGPFSFGDVDLAADCGPNPSFERLLGVLMSRSATDPDAVVVDEAVYNAVSGDALHVLHLDRPAAWHGLQLVEVRFHHGIESGPSNYSLVFADSPDRVRSVWNARGWDLPPAGQTRVIDDEVIATAVGIVAEGELAAVTCFRD